MNFSDRFLAKVSGTNVAGNSANTVSEYLRKVGVPLQERWDFTSDIDTFEKFYSSLPAKLFDYAKSDFLDKYKFNHEYVNPSVENIKQALKFSPICVSVAAWFRIGDIYYKPEGAIDNHWVICYGYDDTQKAWKIFDSYEDNLKLYSYNANITVAKRYSIEKISKPISFRRKLLNWFA